MPEGYLHLILPTTLPDLRALAKRPLASPHRAANWGRSVDDQPRACSQHRGARLSLKQAHEKASQRREEASDKPRKMTPDLVELIEEKLTQEQWSPRSDQRASGEGWCRLYQSRAHLSACLERQERRGHARHFHLRHSGKKYNRRKGKNSGRGLIPNRVDIDQRPPIVAAKSRIGRLGGRHDYRRQSQRRCHVARRANLQIHQARQTAGQERGLCRAGLRTRALAAR